MMAILDIVCGTTTGSELADRVNESKVLAERASKTYWFVDRSNASAITHVGGATDTYLTNNANATVSYNPDGEAPIWDATTNSFNLSNNKIGDVVHFSAKCTFNNLAAQEIDMFISAAEGTGTAHEHQINHAYYKTAATNTGFTFNYMMTIENADEIDGGARFRFASVQAASITVENFTTVITSV